MNPKKKNKTKTQNIVLIVLVALLSVGLLLPSLAQLAFALFGG